MTTKEIKLMIIQNFIEYYTTDEDERMDMIGNAQTYVDEDWVDEIAQSGCDKEVTDKDIIAYAKWATTTSKGALSPLIETGIMIGAKAMRDNLIPKELKK
jgi:hypothetical protein